MSDETKAPETETAPAPEAAAAAPEAAPAPVADPARITPTVSSTLPEDEVERITADLIGVLKTVYDPEIPVDIYELGLIYKVDLDDERNLTIDMTLTAPGCPVAGEMPGWVENAALTVEGVKDVKVNMVFDPPWDASRMSEEAQVALNWW
jgi:FeS assembly SUF system protein